MNIEDLKKNLVIPMDDIMALFDNNEDKAKQFFLASMEKMQPGSTKKFFRKTKKY